MIKRRMPLKNAPMLKRSTLTPQQNSPKTEMGLPRLPFLLLGVAAATKGPCDDYFGKGTDDNSTLITVIDPDIPAQYCNASHITWPCAFQHHTGPYSSCISPGPPDACHRYMKATYSSDCDLLNDGAGGEHAAWAGAVDAARRFDLASGALRECEHHLMNVEITCWAPPADDPVACACPEPA